MFHDTMNNLAEKLLMVFLWLVGWVSGDGMVTALVCWIITLLNIMPKNESFVTGCIWGTAGFMMGNFMVKAYKMPKATNKAL